MSCVWTSVRIPGASVVIRAGVSFVPRSRSSENDFVMRSKFRKHQTSALEFRAQKIFQDQSRETTRRTQGASRPRLIAWGVAYGYCPGFNPGRSTISMRAPSGPAM